MQSVDLNSDMGEGFGPYRLGDDEEILKVVSSASVACGFHAGDPEVMFRTFFRAKELGVAVGAHPGFEDRMHFGRRRLPHTLAEVERLVAYQVGAACSMAALAGHRITYVKPHGALGNWAADDEAVARAVSRAMRAVDPELTYLAIAATAAEHGARAEGIKLASEIFADRAYTPTGTLLPRTQSGAVLHDSAEICTRIQRMLAEGAIIAIDGTRIPTPIDSICVHSDTPDAVTIARELRAAIESKGLAISSFAGRWSAK